MLTRNEQVATPEKFISDNLTHKPSTATSVHDNFAFGLASPIYAVNTLEAEYAKSPAGQTANATYEALKRGNENSEVGWVQWTANEASYIIGQSLNPLTMLMGEVGAVAARPVIALGGRIAPNIFKKPLAEVFGEKMGKYFPKTIGTGEAEKTLSAGLLGEQWAKGFGIGAGVMLPQATLDSFNFETGKHDILGIAEGMGAGGALGMMLGSVPFAWGILKGNFNRLRGRAPSAPIEEGAVEAALEQGHLDKKSYEYWKQVEQYNKSPESRAELNAKGIREKSTEYIASQGHVVDRAKDQAQFEILNRDQINNLQSATVDQLVADHIPEDQRLALSDFVVQAGMDDMRNKPNLLDGVRGYVEYADQNLLKRNEVLARADKLVDEHLTMAHGEMPFDQNTILQTVLTHGKNEQLPFSIPKEVKDRVDAELKIRNLESKNKKLFDKYEETGNKKFTKDMQENNKKIESIKDSTPKLKSPVDELNDIRANLLPLKDNYKSSSYYRRLEDLAEVWHPAKTLLDRVHLEDEINRQEAYRELAKQMLDIADSNVSKLADTAKARNYLESRTTPVIDRRGTAREGIAERNNVPSDEEAIFAEHDRRLETMEVENIKGEYETAKEKFKEFKSQEGIFKNFINCVLGSQK